MSCQRFCFRFLQEQSRSWADVPFRGRAHSLHPTVQFCPVTHLCCLPGSVCMGIHGPCSKAGLFSFFSFFFFNILRPFLPIKSYSIGPMRDVPLAAAEEGCGTHTPLFEVPGPHGIIFHFTDGETDSQEGKGALPRWPPPVGSSGAGVMVAQLTEEETEATGMA